MAWNRAARSTEGSPWCDLHGVRAILCGVNTVNVTERPLYLSKLHAKVVFKGQGPGLVNVLWVDAHTNETELTRHIHV